MCPGVNGCVRKACCDSIVSIACLALKLHPDAEAQIAKRWLSNLLDEEVGGGAGPAARQLQLGPRVEECTVNSRPRREEPVARGELQEG